MTDFLNVYDLDLKKTAILQNAGDIEEEQELNKIYSLEFSLPGSDVKNQYCQPFHYVRYGEGGELYRIISKSCKHDATPVYTYKCEHVIAVLCDTVMFGQVTYGGANNRTKDVINYILSKQPGTVKKWKLNECDFDRKFEYGWEQENLLNALYAIPKEFAKSYRWDFNTTVFPWELSLKEIDDTIHPEFYIRAKHNLLSSQNDFDYTDIVTRIYPLGYGEGVNQLNIKNLTKNNVPYIQSSDAIVQKYGIIEKVMVDRRFENEESLKAYAETMLESLQEPSFSRSFDVVDLYPITNNDILNAKVGKICKFTEDGSIAYITKTRRKLDDPGDLEIELSSKTTDVAETIADLADRVRIESVYAQGATQLYQHSKDANAGKTLDDGMVMNLYFPSEMRQINKVLLKMELESFRAYSKATSGGGALVKSTEVNDQTITTTVNLGTIQTNTNGTDVTGRTEISNSGELDIELEMDQGSRSNSSDWYIQKDHINSGFDINSDYFDEHYHEIPLGDLRHTHNIQHTHNVKKVTGSDHTHNFSLPEHSHGVIIENKKINMTIPSHDHDMIIPEHTHDITPGIYRSGSPKSFDIYVDDVRKTRINSTSYNGDIAKWLLNDEKKIPRDTWIKLTIVPNDIAYVIATIFVQGFVQSRGDETY